MNKKNLYHPCPGAVRKLIGTLASYTLVVMKLPTLKRLFDIALSGIMIILSPPLVLLIAIAIKVEDGGPVLYIQERWGKRKSIFRALKFRSMVQGADSDFGIIPAEDDDHRISKAGRILRATGLDELPQILNIFLGDMSFVGPRPLAVGEIVQDRNGRIIQYENMLFFRERLAVRPGLTGIAAIYIPKDSPPERKFRYDLFYIRKQSFWLDLRLLFLTFWISFRGKWETRGKKI